MNSQTLAKALGWLGVGIGIAELVAPKRLGSSVRMENRQGLLRAFGIREIVTGIGILSQQRRAPWVWARVAGDLADLAALAPRLLNPGRKKGPAIAAAAVAGVTALDLFCSRQLSKSSTGLHAR